MSLLKNRSIKLGLLDFYYSSLHPVCVYARLAGVFICFAWRRRVYCPRLLSPDTDDHLIYAIAIHETVHALQYEKEKLLWILKYIFRGKHRARYEGEAYFADYYLAGDDNKNHMMWRARGSLNSWRYIWCGSKAFEKYVAAYNSEQIVPDKILKAIELINKEGKQNA